MRCIILTLILLLSIGTLSAQDPRLLEHACGDQLAYASVVIDSRREDVSKQELINRLNVGAASVGGIPIDLYRLMRRIIDLVYQADVSTDKGAQEVLDVVGDKCYQEYLQENTIEA